MATWTDSVHVLACCSPPMTSSAPFDACSVVLKNGRQILLSSSHPPGEGGDMASYNAHQFPASAIKADRAAAFASSIATRENLKTLLFSFVV